MQIQPSNNLLRDGLMTLDNIPIFEGLNCCFTTIPFLENNRETAAFAAAPRSQKTGGRINEKYIRALCRALSLPYDNFETGRQVHGINVIETGNGGRFHHPDCDGLLAARKGAAAGVFLADCQPIILWHPDSGTAAVLHAGWRGTVAGMARAGLEAIIRIGSAQTEEVYAFLGPCISTVHYEVGDDVVQAAVNSGLEEAVVTGDIGKSLFGLTRANAAVLAKNGLPNENIHTSDVCTYDSPDYFYSYRRDGDDAGRFMAAIYIEG